MKEKSESEVAQLCLTLCDPIDSSPPGSSIHGIFQARVLEWGAIGLKKKVKIAMIHMRCRNHEIFKSYWQMHVDVWQNQYNIVK